MSAVVEWGYQDLRLVELVEELMLRQQEIAELVQRLWKERAFTATIIQFIICIPGTGGVAVTSFFRDFLFKPAKNKMWLSGKIGKKGKAYTIDNKT